MIPLCICIVLQWCLLNAWYSLAILLNDLVINEIKIQKLIFSATSINLEGLSEIKNKFCKIPLRNRRRQSILEVAYWKTQLFFCVLLGEELNRSAGSYSKNSILCFLWIPFKIQVDCNSHKSKKSASFTKKKLLDTLQA